METGPKVSDTLLNFMVVLIIPFLLFIYVFLEFWHQSRVKTVITDLGSGNKAYFLCFNTWGSIRSARG
jgi:hypothetical protein